MRSRLKFVTRLMIPMGSFMDVIMKMQPHVDIADFITAWF